MIRREGVYLFWHRSRLDRTNNTNSLRRALRLTGIRRRSPELFKTGGRSVRSILPVALAQRIKLTWPPPRLRDRLPYGKSWLLRLPSLRMLPRSACRPPAAATTGRRSSPACKYAMRLLWAILRINQEVAPVGEIMLQGIGSPFFFKAILRSLRRYHEILFFYCKFGTSCYLILLGIKILH